MRISKKFYDEAIKVADAKYTGKTWNEFISNVESKSGYKVDSAYKRKYDQWIELLKGGKSYSAEVTKYTDGSYELMDYNISKRANDNKTVDVEPLKMELEIKVSNFKDGKLRIDFTNHYWDKHSYAFWDGKELSSYSPVAAKNVKWGLEQLKINPKNLKAGMNIHEKVSVKLS